MTETTDNSVLMKCINYGHQEYLPEKDLLLLREVYNLKPEYEDTVLCRFCLHDMYRIDSDRFRKQSSRNMIKEAAFYYALPAD